MPPGPRCNCSSGSQRRDLVRKGARHEPARSASIAKPAVPGFAACFDKLWEKAGPLALTCNSFPPPCNSRRPDWTTLCQSLRPAGIRFQQRTLQTVLDWATQAAPGDVAADQHLRIAWAYYRDRQQKTLEIQALERELAGRLAQTPYILLLSFPGSNVVSAADFGAEAGPMEH